MSMSSIPPVGNNKIYLVSENKAEPAPSLENASLRETIQEKKNYLNRNLYNIKELKPGQVFYLNENKDLIIADSKLISAKNALQSCAEAVNSYQEWTPLGTALKWGASALFNSATNTTSAIIAGRTVEDAKVAFNGMIEYIETFEKVIERFLDENAMEGTVSLEDCKKLKMQIDELKASYKLAQQGFQNGKKTLDEFDQNLGEKFQQLNNVVENTIKKVGKMLDEKIAILTPSPRSSPLSSPEEKRRLEVELALVKEENEKLKKENAAYKEELKKYQKESDALLANASSLLVEVSLRHPETEQQPQPVKKAPAPPPPPPPLRPPGAPALPSQPLTAEEKLQLAMQKHEQAQKTRLERELKTRSNPESFIERMKPSAETQNAMEDHLQLLKTLQEPISAKGELSEQDNLDLAAVNSTIAGLNEKLKGKAIINHNSEKFKSELKTLTNAELGYLIQLSKETYEDYSNVIGNLLSDQQAHIPQMLEDAAALDPAAKAAFDKNKKEWSDLLKNVNLGTFVNLYDRRKKDSETEPEYKAQAFNEKKVSKQTDNTKSKAPDDKKVDFMKALVDRVLARRVAIEGNSDEKNDDDNNSAWEP